MKKIGIFYGSSTGVCESIAEKIAEKLQIASSDVNTPDKISSMAADYDVLLLGSSTWGSGELQ
ncbi:MAG: flavodoxin domain-containing protein, partial [Paludibacteraceae bacterium]|nr:flavodoxin domain-containing protein [Paludibacteraceae bacterium]